MEDVLEVYTRPYDPQRPVVCLDETSRQLLSEVTSPQPVAPGQAARQDYEYGREGVCNLFLLTEPLRGWRHVVVSDQRARVDFARPAGAPNARSTVRIGCEEEPRWTAFTGG